MKKVRLTRFNRTVTPPADVEDCENYWILIGKAGEIQNVRPPDESMKDRVLIRFDENLKSLGLEAHNEVQNSLWILKSDVESAEDPSLTTKVLRRSLAARQNEQAQ